MKDRSKPVTIAPVFEHRALSKSQKTFNDLVGRIGKQRVRLAALEAAIPPYQQKYIREFMPVFASLLDVQSQLAHALDQASCEPGLNKRERQEIDEMIVDMVGQLLLDRDDSELKAIYKSHGGADFAAEDLKSTVEEVFGLDSGSFDDIVEEAEAEVLENLKQRDADAQSDADAQPARRKSAKERARDARRHADEQRVSQTIREVYRKLASALHPDRETDPAERHRKTGLMQRVNQAYAKGNLLQLLELQLELEHIDQSSINNISEERLQHYNSILKEQLAEIALEIRHIEADFRARFGLPPFEQVSPKTISRKLARAITDMEETIVELKRDIRACGDLTSLRQLLARERRLRRTQGFGDMPV